MATSTHVFQAPKGTRDFLPGDMAVRRHIEGVWRDASIAHGFDEIEGPNFEHLDLYTAKSGPGIVSELFSFKRSGGDTEYALRPEFTPTLARIVAARGASLPRPVKWFSVPVHFRAERPQRGRLREFVQWNADVVGAADAWADAEIIAVSVSVLDRLGLTPDDVRVRISHRHTVAGFLQRLGVTETQLPAAFDLLDRRDKMTPEAFEERATALQLEQSAIQRFDELGRAALDATDPLNALAMGMDVPADDLEQLANLKEELGGAGLDDWCEFDLGIVRGLAYYTGTVFEIHERSGKERAIAGGGRYDDLVELFGGAPTPAVGIAMGDVVIRLVLEDRGLLEPAEAYMPRPDVFVIASGDGPAQAELRPLVARLRGLGLHVRRSYRTTTNVGKLLGEAGRVRARYAVILGRELEEGSVVLKDLDAGDQREVTLTDLPGVLSGAPDR